MKIFKKMKKGFTLVELVVVIAVIAILAAVSVGAYFGVTESANNSRLEQESKQVYTAIQTVALAPNDHSSLSKDGLVITDDTKFELALEESLGKTVTLLENGNKVSNEPTIFFLTTAVSRLGGAEITYKTFEYHIPEISGKKAVADVVTGDVKVESSDVETGTDVPTTTVPDATTETPTIAPTVETTQTPTTSEPVRIEKTYEYTLVKGDLTSTGGNKIFDGKTFIFPNTSYHFQWNGSGSGGYQIGSGTTPASSYIITTTNFSNIKSISLKGYTASSGNSTANFTIGNQTLNHTSKFTTTNEYLTVENINNYDGDLKIEICATAKAFYLTGFKIVYFE